MQVTVPSALPEIDEVEVLDLATFAVDAANSDRNTGTASSFPIAGDDAIKIADLFRNLPDGDERRCHTPPFSLRFLASGVEVGTASVCWKCNNVRGKISGQPGPSTDQAAQLASCYSSLSGLSATAPRSDCD